jgi:hypothetical protein
MQMFSKKRHKQGLTSYARMFIGMLPALVRMIRKHSRQTATTTSPVLPITILSESQIQQALNQPQCESLRNFIQTAYKDTIHLDNLTNDSQRMLEEQQIIIESTLYSLKAARDSSNISDAFKAKAEIAMQSLYKQLDVIHTIEADIRKAVTQSAALKNDFTSLLDAQETELDVYRAKQLKQLHEVLDEILVNAGYHKLDPVPGGEVDNLLRADLQEALDRYEDLAARDLTPKEMEKMLGLTKPDVATFFKIKAYLALRSVNPPLEDRPKLMRQLEQFFEQAKKEGTEILQKQSLETKRLDETNVKPVLQIAANCHAELQALAKDREKVIKPVETRQLRRQIRLQVQQRIGRLPTP